MILISEIDTHFWIKNIEGEIKIKILFSQKKKIGNQIEIKWKRK